MNAPTLAPAAGVTLRQYVDGLRAAGIRVAPGSGGTYWAASGGVVRRLPTFHVGIPLASEVDDALRRTGALVASYLTEADVRHAANAWLYLCTDRTYALTGLAPAMRRNVRRALQELEIAPLAGADVLDHGSRTFCDTRRRAGLNDATPRGFRRYFEHGIDVERGTDRPGISYLGAWRGGQLAAFVAIVHVDEWIELNCFSMDAMLRYRPNDALMYLVLSQYLAEARCRVVSFGLSSIQARSKVAGLHRFKRKVGFTPSRVHRAFVLHPSVRAFANPVTLTAVRWLVNGALRVLPGHGRLRKFEGMLACMLGSGAKLAAEQGSDEPELCRPVARRDSLCAT